jgi:general secretion pathway protein A
MTREETRAYVFDRLRIAGNPHDKIFDEDCFALIYSISGGFPRLINIICDSALLAGFARGAKTLNAELVKESIQYLELQTPAPRIARGKLRGRLGRGWKKITSLFRSG